MGANDDMEYIWLTYNLKLRKDKYPILGFF
jgi:hypothetical protein